MVSHSPESKPPHNQKIIQSTYIVGLILIVIGATFLLEKYLQTGWLFLALGPAIGLALMSGGVIRRQRSYIIAGSLFLSIGISLYIYFGIVESWSWSQRLGLAILAFGGGWLLISLLALIFLHKKILWSLIPAVMLFALGGCFLFSQLRWVDFDFYLITAAGLVFLAAGLYHKTIGLVIPGSLLITIGPAIFQAWGTAETSSALVKTGILLVILALGWGLITVFSRVIKNKFIWWPLIPGGILAVTGWGLYIGGDPNNALGFIGNTGSVALIIIGIYLLLLRHGIQK